MVLGSDTRAEFGSLWSLYEWVMIVTTAIVFGTVLFAAWRYRSRRGHAPSAKSEANVAELVYTLILVVVVAVLVTRTFTTENRVDAIASNVKQHVEVTAFKWGWRFTYPGSGVSVVGDDQRRPTLHLPVDEPIVFVEHSRDVVHSFWVPALRFKRDAWPDDETEFELTVDRAGVYAGRCGEFCGLHHADMNFTVVAESRERFERWLRAQ
ncbi:MAG TPA: cytochrome c oxidase subunit II [Gaiellaceae bacterium]|nr:cytochrome c oxidase subunit II [Gaiellaceae bacterium]